MLNKDAILFKAATFLTALVRSERSYDYITYGFKPKDMTEEIFRLSANSSLEMPDQVKERIEESIDEVLSCLSKEGLIYYVEDDGRYHITNTGKNISSFMANLSKLYFEESNQIMKYPYRFYPNSPDIYGLN